jgi:exodeoxyribonuclease-3
MKIISWNVNGIRAAGKKGLVEFVEEQNPDFMCLQETKAHIDQVEPQLQNLGYSQFCWSSAVKKGYSGVATFTDNSKVQLINKSGFKDYDSEGRIVIAETPHFDLYNIYFPNGGSGDERHLFKQNFLKVILAHFKSEMDKGKSLVVVGDYNVAHKAIDVHDPVRLSKESGFLPEEQAWFSDFLKAGFVDTFRHVHGDQPDRYSWWSYRELARVNNRGWRIDYICVSQDLQKNLVSADILDAVEGSDHCPVVAEFKF